MSRDLHGLIVMGHDWGGPIGLSAACAEPERVAGLVLGGTWFWPADLRARIFSRVMSSRPLQRAILQRNLFVERFIPRGTNRQLSARKWSTTGPCSPPPRGSASPRSARRRCFCGCGARSPMP